MKNTPYLPNQHRKLAQFLEDLSQHQLDSTNRQLKDLLNKKKARLREIYSLSSHEVIQPKMLSSKMSSISFTEVSPMAVGEPFLDEKIKANILKPNRFYSKEPNGNFLTYQAKAGSFILPKRSSMAEDKRIVNAEFEEYSRIIDQQSGQAKHKKLLKLLAVSEQTKGKQKYIRMKKTLFQRFMPDKYNFYNNPTTFKKSSTFQASTLKRSQSKHLRSEIEESVLGETGGEIPASMKQIRTIEVTQQTNLRNIKRSTILEKSRLKTNTIDKDVYQKNINSIG